MKISNILLLSFFGLVAISGISFMVMLKSELTVATEAVNQPGATRPEVEIFTKDVELPAFNTVVYGEDLDLTIKSGDQPGLKIVSTQEEDLDFNITSEVSDGVLTVGFGEGDAFGSSNIQLEVITPKVRQIILNNNARFELEDFQQDSLTITVTGEARANLENNALSFVKIDGNDDGRITISDAGNASFDVMLHGDASVRIEDMDRAALKGEIRDRSFLRLQGSLNTFAVSTDEGARIVKED